MGASDEALDVFEKTASGKKRPVAPESEESPKKRVKRDIQDEKKLSELKSDSEQIPDNPKNLGESKSYAEALPIPNKQKPNPEVISDCSKSNSEPITGNSKLNPELTPDCPKSIVNSTTDSSKSNSEPITESSKSNSELITESSKSNSELLPDSSKSNSELTTESSKSNTWTISDSSNVLPEREKLAEEEVSKSIVSKDKTLPTDSLHEKIPEVVKDMKETLTETTSEKQKHEKEVCEANNTTEDMSGGFVMASSSKIDSVFNQYEVQEVDDFSVEGCVHKIVYPPRIDIVAAREKRAKPLPPHKPEKEYPFKLDEFQVRAVECVERKENVLVAAHTSAGKTTVAEYAIAKSLNQKSRVIYTSPIKALSNQKYRELHEEFKDVGLMTGDVTINQTAGCLVMTTEILRNMLYRGSEVIREIAWVIFDEVHYMRDKERGVVWEECLILLPKNARFVFLSATLPNCKDFAGWIAKLNRSCCNVIYTEFRPVPLQHYIFPARGEGIHLVVDEQRRFRELNFQKALAALMAEPDPKFARKGKEIKNDLSADVFKLCKMIMQRKYDPVIVFCFSRKDCEAHALKMMRLDFCEEGEKKMIAEVFNNAIDSLNEDDRKLPQVTNIIHFLKRGIGIHHSGLLPLLKETIEILFSEGLIKCLFATETFSMGINMPAKTVIFTSVRKFDGLGHRLLTSGEYVQMSGRSGRRGKDQRGVVIMMIDKKIEASQAKEMLRGIADPLISSFHLGFNMLLNLMRVEDAHPQFLIERSFLQFQSTLKSPEIGRKIRDVREKMEELAIPPDTKVGEYYGLRQRLEELAREYRAIRNDAKYLLPFINVGRLIKITEFDVRTWGWGIITSMKQLSETELRKIGDATSDQFELGSYLLYVLLKCKKRTLASDPVEPYDPTPLEDGTRPKSTWLVLPCQMKLVENISTLRVSFLPKNLKDKKARRETGEKLEQVLSQRLGPRGPPELHPVKHLKIREPGFKDIMKKIQELEDVLECHPLHNSPQLEELYNRYCENLTLQSELEKLEAKKEDLDTSLRLYDKLKGMERVLRRLGLSTEDGVVTEKGRVAAELTTGDELVAAELIYSGKINDLDAAQLASLASCFVFSDKNEDTIKLKEKLEAPFQQLRILVRRVAEAQLDAKIALDVDDFIKKFNPGLMDITYAWAKGAKFSDIMKMTYIFEGSVIRVLRRLEEFLSELFRAVEIIGNEPLKLKFSEAIKLIKRDIVFTASLYT